MKKRRPFEIWRGAPAITSSTTSNSRRLDTANPCVAIAWARPLIASCLHNVSSVSSRVIAAANERELLATSRCSPLGPKASRDLERLQRGGHLAQPPGDPTVSGSVAAAPRMKAAKSAVACRKAVR